MHGDCGRAMQPGGVTARGNWLQGRILTNYKPLAAAWWTAYAAPVKSRCLEDFTDISRETPEVKGPDPEACPVSCSIAIRAWFTFFTSGLLGLPGERGLLSCSASTPSPHHTTTEEDCYGLSGEFLILISGGYNPSKGAYMREYTGQARRCWAVVALTLLTRLCIGLKARQRSRFSRQP